MIKNNINLVHVVVHKFTGSQIFPGQLEAVFNDNEQTPTDSNRDLSVRIKFIITPQVNFLECHFQIDEILIPTDEDVGYRLQFCILGIFEVGEKETEQSVKEFAIHQLPNIIAPIVSEHHQRFTIMLHSGSIPSQLQLHIPHQFVQELMSEEKFKFSIVEKG